MYHAYTKSPLVDQLFIGLFTTLGWHTVSMLKERFGVDGALEPNACTCHACCQARTTIEESLGHD